MTIDKYYKMFLPLFAATSLGLSSAVNAGNIAAELSQVEVLHHGKPVTISRESDKAATIPKAYLKTARKCPPFCVQPMQISTNIETVGELEVLGYLKRIHGGDRSVMVIDSRTPEWIGRGTIPGSVNVPWSRISLEQQAPFGMDAEAENLEEILKQFGVRINNGKRDFRNVKTLVLFCNGAWCPQSAANIRTLSRLGYPDYKLKWYRGGVQSWVTMGLTTVNN